MSSEKSCESLVSIILPTYNREKYLNRSIDSVLNQTYKNWELLIIDDGSNDGTLSLVKNYLNQFSNIRYFYHENRGAAYSMNVGMQNSLGKFITFLGSDDEYLANHLEIRVEYLEENMNVDLLHSPAKIIGDKYVKDKNDITKNIHLGLSEDPGKWHEVSINPANDYETNYEKGYKDLQLDRLVINLGVWTVNDGSDFPYGIYFTDLKLDYLQNSEQKSLVNRNGIQFGLG